MSPLSSILSASSEHRKIRAGRYACIMAGFYVLTAGLYVYFSTAYSASIAGSVEELARLETVKGIGFILVTGVSMLVFNYFLLRRLNRQQQELWDYEANRHKSEQVLLAGTFAGAIAHDINNALSVVHLSLHELKEILDGDPEREELLHDMSSAVKNIQLWNRRLFELGGKKHLGDVRELDLGALVQDCVAIARRHEAVKTCQVTVEVPQSVRFRGTPSVLQRAILNLLMNAAEATGPAGSIAVRVYPSDEYVTVRVEDNGPGVPEELTKRIYEPFFTTKRDGNGLGLASVVACAEAHAGKVEVQRSELGGAAFQLLLQHA